MCIDLKNSRAKFHPNPVWNYEALGFLKGIPNKNKNNKMISDMESVPDPKVCNFFIVIVQLMVLGIFWSAWSKGW